jgi:hypothetical protein
MRAPALAERSGWNWQPQRLPARTTAGTTAAVVGAGEGRGAVRADEAMHEIGVGAVPDTFQKRVLFPDLQPRPAHVRHGQGGAGLKGRTRPGIRPSRAVPPPSSLVEQQLLAEADAEQGTLRKARIGLDQVPGPEPAHGVAWPPPRRAGSAVRPARPRRGRCGEPHGGAEPLQRELDRGDIAGAVGQDRDLPGHSTPLVEGTASPSMRMA